MEDEVVEVEISLPVRSESEPDSTPEPVTTESVIDAAIDSGIAAGAATDAASDAEVAAIDANYAAADAGDAAAAAQAAAAETNETLVLLRTLTQQNAEMLAAMQAGQSAQIVGALPDVGDTLNPSVDVDLEPDSPHWLTRRWGPKFGKATR